MEIPKSLGMLLIPALRRWRISVNLGQLAPHSKSQASQGYTKDQSISLLLSLPLPLPFPLSVSQLDIRQVLLRRGNFNWENGSISSAHRPIRGAFSCSVIDGLLWVCAIPGQYLVL